MKKNIARFTYFLILCSLVFTKPVLAKGLDNPLQFGTVWGVLAAFLPVLAGGGGLALLGYLLYGAYLWMTAGDKSEKLEGAKKTISNAVIGFALFGVMVALFFFLSYILGVNWVKLAGNITTTEVTD